MVAMIIQLAGVLLMVETAPDKSAGGVQESEVGDKEFVQFRDARTDWRFGQHVAFDGHTS